MPLTDSDYLHWYSDEVTRYRNYEWRIAGYSIGISYATLLFTSNPDTKFLVPNTAILAILLALFISSLLAAEAHVHHRLNEYRSKRDLLRSGGDHLHAAGALWKGQGWRDRLFFLGFMFYPLVIGYLAVNALVAQQ